MFGLGFVIGPMLGSLLMASGSVNAIFTFGLVFATLDIILVAAVLKETNHNRSHRKVAINPFPILRKYISSIEYRWIMISLLFLGIATFSYQSIISILVEERFGIPGSHI